MHLYVALNIYEYINMTLNIIVNNTGNICKIYVFICQFMKLIRRAGRKTKLPVEEGYTDGSKRKD